MNENLYTVHMGKAKCAVDLGDGSERGEYVNQDYILHKMGRPHRSISLMYCYYPFDKQFPGRMPLFEGIGKKEHVACKQCPHKGTAQDKGTGYGKAEEAQNNIRHDTPCSGQGLFAKNP